MVQGKSKGLHRKASSSRAGSKASQPKKGQRAIPPKKPAAIKHAAMQQSLAAKIGRSIEQQMVSAASNGKLTIMKSDVPAGSSSVPKKKAKP